MATVQDIKRRVRSVRNTRKITRALELVAAAKLKRAHSRIEDMRPYADRMLELMAGTARASSSVRGLPLLQKRETELAVAIVPLTGDRGLAGAFNSQILRRALALERELRGEGKQVRWVGVGRRGVGSLRFRRFELQQVLPLSEDLLETDDTEREEDAMRGDFIFEPEPEQILERLLPVYVETEVYRALLESAASEHGARMTAMRNASKNAEELIDDLTLAMNRARQAEITQEILEVVGGADALSG
jgi:F-type H+-transporting ATPase subunit gamma